jgi:hypothetical protein
MERSERSTKQPLLRPLRSSPKNDDAAPFSIPHGPFGLGSFYGGELIAPPENKDIDKKKKARMDRIIVEQWRLSLIAFSLVSSFLLRFPDGRPVPGKLNACCEAPLEALCEAYPPALSTAFWLFWTLNFLSFIYSCYFGIV